MISTAMIWECDADDDRLLGVKTSGAGPRACALRYGDDVCSIQECVHMGA